MGNLINEFCKLFFIEKEEIQVEEKFTFFSIKTNLLKVTKIEKKELSGLLNFIHKSDEFYLYINVDGNEEKISSIENLDISSNKVNNLLADVESDSESSIKLTINKSNKFFTTIYSLRNFEDFWLNFDTIKLLDTLKKYKYENAINFLLLEKEELSFNTKNIIFSKEENFTSILLDSTKKSDNCYFGKVGDFTFSPDFFKVINYQEGNKIIESLNKLCLIFSIAYIYDISSINGNVFYCKINGYKSFEYNIQISIINISMVNIYYKIFDWIYSSNGNVDDKIGLVRNILTLSLKENSLEIPDSVYTSVQSGYKAYLQENVSKYIEIRNKISDDLLWVSQKSGDVVIGYIGSYSKSIFTFLSFYISVFLLRFLKDNEEVFSKEVTIFGIVFLALSLIYMWFSKWNINQELKRIRVKYKLLKDRYKDLLDESDIERILNKDKEFKYEMSYVNTRISNYTLLWYLTLLIFYILVVSLSSWISIFGFIVSVLIFSILFLCYYLFGMDDKYIKK